MSGIDRVKVFVKHNWQLKLLSAMLAALVVYEAREATSFEVPYDIPIKVEPAEGIAGQGIAGILALFLFRMMQMNVVLAVFNLLPIPPLDGFGILAPLLSRNVRAMIYSFSMFGFFLIFILFAMNPSIRSFFQTTVDSMMTTLNVNPRSFAAFNSGTKLSRKSSRF